MTAHGGGWNACKFLLYDPEGELCGVETITGKFFKGTPPASLAGSWLSSATLLGSGGDWSVFHFLFFDPQGILYRTASEEASFMRGAG